MKQFLIEVLVSKMQEAGQGILSRTRRFVGPLKRMLRKLARIARKFIKRKLSSISESYYKLSLNNGRPLQFTLEKVKPQECQKKMRDHK